MLRKRLWCVDSTFKQSMMDIVFVDIGLRCVSAVLPKRWIRRTDSTPLAREPSTQRPKCFLRPSDRPLSATWKMSYRYLLLIKTPNESISAGHYYFFQLKMLCQPPRKWIHLKKVFLLQHSPYLCRRSEEEWSCHVHPPSETFLKSARR